MILLKVLTKEFVEDGTSQFQNFLVNFHKFHTLLSKRLSQLGWTIRSFAQDGVLKMLMGVHKMQRMALALTFFRAIPPDDDELLNHIV
jgi:hypothetical protein